MSERTEVERLTTELTRLRAENNQLAYEADRAKSDRDKAEAALAVARQERDEFKEVFEFEQLQTLAYEAKLAAAERENARLREYVKHKQDCASVGEVGADLVRRYRRKSWIWHQLEPLSCDCGLAAALASAPAPQQETK